MNFDNEVGQLSGGIEYIPNQLPDNNNTIDFASMINTKSTPLLGSPYKQVVVNNDSTNNLSTDFTSEIDPNNEPVAPGDPWSQMMAKSNSYHNTFSNKPMSVGQLKNEIAKVESDGLGGYKAYNPGGGGEGAVGKYQFRWNLWKDDIGKVTNIKDKQQFLNSPQAQEDFFDYYQKNTLLPQMKQIRKEFPNLEFSDTDIMKLLHFRGIGKKDENDGGLRSQLRNGKLTSKIESNNMSAAGYLKASKA